MIGVSEERVTLFIPSYERHVLLLRSLQYWSGKAVKVVVFDGSREPLSKKDLQWLKDNITYNHTPVPLYERFEKMCSCIETEYVSLLSDDEFFTMSGLNAAVTFLDGNDGYAVAGGYPMAFTVNGSKCYSQPIYPRMKNRDITHDKPKDRMQSHMSCYTPSTLYSLARSSVWLNVMQMIIKRELTFYGAWELQFEAGVHLFGKSINLATLYWFRNFESEPIRGTSASMEPSRSFASWWADDEYDERAAFLQAFAELGSLGTAAAIGRPCITSKDVEAAFDCYLLSMQTAVAKRPQKYRSLRAIIKKLLPILIPVFSAQIPFQATASFLNKEGVSFVADEIDEIHDILQKSH